MSASATPASRSSPPACAARWSPKHATSASSRWSAPTSPRSAAIGCPGSARTSSGPRPSPPRHRQVKLEGDGEAPKLARAANLCGSLGASDLGPDRERLRADGSVVSGRKMIAVQVEEVVDLVVGGEEPLRLAG